MQERIKEIRKDFNKNQTDFGTSVYVTRSAVAQWEAGINVPSEQTIRLICSTYGVNYEWLKSGTGKKETPACADDEMVDRIMTGKDEFKKAIFRAYAKLDDQKWELLKKIYQEISESMKKDGQ